MPLSDVSKPSKPTITSVIIGVLGFAWKLFGFFDSENGLQAWLNSNQHTALGSVMSELIGWAPVFLFVGLLLWWHDSSTNKVLGQVQPGSPYLRHPTAEAETQNTLRATQRSLRKELSRNEIAQRDLAKERETNALLSSSLAEMSGSVQRVNAVGTVELPEETIKRLLNEIDELTAALNEASKPPTLLRAGLINRAQRTRDFLKSPGVTVGDYLREFNFGEISGTLDRLPIFPMESTTREMLRDELMTLPFHSEDITKIADALEKLAYIVPEDALA